MADGKIPRQEPDLYELIGKKLLVPKNKCSNPKKFFGNDMDGFAVGEVMQYNPKRKKPFNIQFRNEKNLGRTVFLVHLKYVLDYIEELPEQLQWLKNIEEKSNDERKPPWPSLKKSQPECNDSEGTVSESEIEHPATKKVKCAAKTAPTPAAPQNKKKVAAVPNKKDLIPDSVLSDTEIDNDAPSE